jgi:uncharacterized membrane protein
MGPWCAQIGAGGWLAMVVFWLVVIGLAIWAVSRLFPARPEPDAFAVLDARLASGEIDAATYRWIREELSCGFPVESKGHT